MLSTKKLNMKQFNKEHYLGIPVYRQEIDKLYKNKNSPEKIAKIVGHKVTRHDVEKVLDEMNVKRRDLRNSMFKGNKIPTRNALYRDRIVNKMSTCEMGIKYGTPEKPISENTIVRWLKRKNLYKGKKPKTEKYIPKKEELEEKLKHFTKREIASQYHKRYEWVVSLIDNYGLENKVRTANGQNDEEIKIEKDIKEDDIVAGGRDPRIPLSLEDCSSLNGQKSEGLDPQPQGQGQPQPQGRFLQKIENDVLLIKTKPITELIGAFKSRSSQNIHKLGFKDFVWQTSFYDRIIRNNVEYDSIQKYIIDNPKNWKKFWAVPLGFHYSRNRR